MRIAARVRGAVAAAVLVAISGRGSADLGRGAHRRPLPRGLLDCCRVNNGQTGRDLRDGGHHHHELRFPGTGFGQPGSTVTVKNEGSQAHTVTSDQAGLVDAVVPGGGNVVFTAPTTTGSYGYHCTYHSNMHGTLVVK